MSQAGESSIVTKCANMVDILAMSQRPLTFSELTNRSGLVKSSAHRILNVLLTERLASYDADNKTYALGSRTLSWARSYLKRSDLPSIADRHMDALCQQTVMNGALSLLDRNAVLYLKTYNPVPVKFASLAGDRVPLHCTAAGKVFLAFMPDQKRRELLENIEFEPFTEFTIRDAKTLEEDLEQVRKQGFALALQEEIYQVLGISAPIFGGDGKVLATISLWNLNDRLGREEIRKLAKPLIKVTRQISKDYISGKV